MKTNIKLVVLFFCIVWMSNPVFAKKITNVNKQASNLNYPYQVTTWTGHPNVNTTSSPNFYKSGWGWNTGGIISDVRIPCGQDGFIEHSFTTINNHYYIIGLSEDDPSYPTSTTALDYAWYVNPSIVQTRVPYLNSYINHSYTNGQNNVLRIEKIGSLVYFKLNGIVVGTHPIDPDKEYYVGGMINSGGTNTISISCSHKSLINSNGYPITTWTGHSNVNTTSSPSFYKSGWGWATGGFISDVKILSQLDGFVEHTFTTINNRYYMIGLSENDPSYPTSTTTLDYAWYVTPSLVQTRVPHLNSYINHSYTNGQNNVLRIEKIGCWAYFKLNGVVVVTHPIDPDKEYYVGGMINSTGTNTIPISCSHKLTSSRRYATLSHKLNGGYYQVSDDKLYFEYYEEYKDGDLEFHLYNENNNEETSINQANLTNLETNTNQKKYGTNRFQLDISTLNPSSSGEYYILEVINDKQEIFKLKFLRI
ncbi:MAG: hypothetical protein ACI9LI_000266 [Saprospiraceae bacterium]|jgi:hypothetical protein